MLARASHRRGFTLMEIMLVVAIILVLVALLVPSLSLAKKRARRVDNEALLNSIANAIQQYETTFNAYPGPPVSGMTIAAGPKMSGTQALLLALGYTWVDESTSSPDKPPNDALTVFGIPSNTSPNVIFNFTNANGTYKIVVNPSKPTGPRDHGNASPSGAYRALVPFYTPTNRELSPPTSSGSGTWPNGGYADSTPSPKNTFAFPTLIDHYSLPMPILYFRGTPGVAGTLTYDSSGNPDTSTAAANTVVGETANATFLRQENVEYLESTGFNTSMGISPDQSTSSPISNLYPGNGNDPKKTDAALAKLLTDKGISRAMPAKGSAFVLMSAGEDRIYGTADDIIVIR